MFYYYCNDENNYNDADFLLEFDKLEKRIAKEFSILQFPHQVNNLTSTDFLIIDIFACHDSQTDLIDNLVTLKNYNGINPVIYIPKGNIKDSSGIVKELRAIDIPVLYKINFQQEMIKIVYRAYNMSPMQVVEIDKSESVTNEEAEFVKNSELGISKKEKVLIKKIMEILEV
ncbi:Uncharacterised protein [Eubacterium limosum]|uniref:Uncharacterized protein n=1 Tax=Eubacterium limosum TaxID=1736 RepID=A0A6N3HCE3_EUBLI